MALLKLRRPANRPGSHLRAAVLAVALGCVAPLVALSGPATAAPPTPCGPRVTDPLVEPPWPLTRLKPQLAWPLSTGAGVTVAVIDSGVSDDHPVLRGKVRPGKDYLLPGGAGNCDENGHGTLIAGIIAGRQDVSAGYTFSGIAPDATIVPVRVLRDQRRSLEDDLPDKIGAAIRWSVEVGGADVINLSLTTPPSPALAAAVRHAVAEGVVVVAAAGNQHETGTSAETGQSGVYPAGYDGVIAVAGVDRDDAHVSSSVTGGHLDVAAPGARIAGPSPAGGGYLFTEEGGTSFAAAYVSGLAALIRSREPTLAPPDVARRITETADHPADLWNPTVGYGVINPARALGALVLERSPAALGVGQVRRPTVPADPLESVTRSAVAVAFTGGGATLLVLLGVPVVRRGRRRGWRAGRADEPGAT